MKKQIIENMLFLTWSFLLITLALNIFGISTYEPVIYNPNLIQIIDVVNNNRILQGMINVFFSIIATNLMYASNIENYQNYYLKLNVICIPIFIYVNIVDTVMLPLISLIGYVLPLLAKTNIFTCFKIFFIDTLFLSIIMYVQNISITNQDYNFTNFLYIGIELILLWSLYFIYNLQRSKTKCLYLTLIGDFFQHHSKKQKEDYNEKNNKLKTARHSCIILKKKLRQLKQKYQNFKLYLKFSLVDDLRDCIPLFIVYFIYIGYAIFINKFIESIFLYFAYLKLYKLFPKNFHSDYIPNIKSNLIEITCVCLTSIVLCTALFLTIGGGVSVISTIIIAFVINWFSYAVRDHLDYQAELKKTRKLKLTEETIYYYFQEFKTLDKYYDYLVFTLVKKKRDVDWFRLESNRYKNIDEQQYRNYKTKFVNLVKSSKIL